MKDSSIVKIAVEMKDQNPQLIEFNQKQPLAAIIQDLCSAWGLSESEQFSLQFTEGSNNNYITEKNRTEIKNGSVLRLVYSASKTAYEILQKLNATNADGEKMQAVQRLCKLSTDMTFALEFINKQGLALIISLVESGKCEEKETLLACILMSFVELMDHGIVSWDILENNYISKIASHVSNQAKAQDNVVLQASLSILENIVLNSSGKYSQVEKEVPVTNIVHHLQSNQYLIQQNAMALLNALFIKADTLKKKDISSTVGSKHVRNIILNNILQAPQTDEMSHQLYVLQTLMFNLLEERITLKMEPHDQVALEKIKELRKIAFDTDDISAKDATMRKQGLLAKDYKKLGFKYDINPSLDFSEVPPGMLALDCMIYFARNHVENYTKVVLENSCRADEHECPFGRTSVELTKLLIDILKIRELPSEHGRAYQPMLFTHDHPFEELFSTGIVLLNKTWKEMRATTEDFAKVMSVVREQLTRALIHQPTTFDKFKQYLNTLTYAEITSIWLQERMNKEAGESQAKPIIQLKEKITPDIMDLIQQQRLGYLVEGTRFTKVSTRQQRSKQKYWFVRLSPNYKVLHYGDCDEKSTPTVEELQNKLSILDIKSLVVGKECPHIKDSKNRSKTTHQFAFALIIDSGEMQSLDFIAPDQQVYDYWTDGLNALLGNPMTSEETRNDRDILLGMEIKLRLLDAEGIDIPQEAPQIPPDPPNYDFVIDK